MNADERGSNKQRLALLALFAVMSLAKVLVEIPLFDPSHPDPVATFDVPKSPMSAMVKPDGN
jgi:hypothetical protein